jgi:thiamine pyrophosphokinase
MALGPVSGITTSGVRWPLAGESLAPGVRDGTLNEVLSETVTIEVESGNLLVQLHHAAPCYTETDADA